MNEPASPAPGEPSAARPNRPSLLKRVGLIALVAIAVWALVAYVIAPFVWERYAHRHPSFDAAPNITQTGDKHPGDPINVSLIGDKTQVIKIMLDADWHPADPLSLRSSLEIAEATMLERPYEDAPVSNLYLFGRKEDLAFEKQVGPDPKERHHVRYWKSADKNPDGRDIWLGSISFDKSVGLSHITGQITHHISPDVDAERDLLLDDLKKTGDLSETYAVDGFHKVLKGKNGEGDPWHTDGRLFVGVIREDF